MPAKRSNRREFLSGAAARDAIGDLLIPTGDVVGATPRASHLMHVSRRAMACEFEIYLNASQSASGIEPALEALDLVDALEDQLTVYRDHSEVSRLNQRAADEAVPVEEQLFQLLERAIQLHRETAGAFDITAGPLSKVWGFHRRQGGVPEQRHLEEALKTVGSQHLLLDAEQRTARFSQAGLEINLGAIGKGYALDRAAEELTADGVENFLMHGGASSIVARGCRLGEQPEAWSVALRHPLKPEIRLGEILVDQEALGTSGSANQFFYRQGRRYGHVLDPRDGRPAEGVLSTTVWAPTAAAADALATAFYVMGYEAAKDYCETRPELAALFALPGKRSGELLIRPIGDVQERWRQASRD